MVVTLDGHPGGVSGRLGAAGQGALVAVVGFQVPGGDLISERLTKKARTRGAAVAAWLFALLLFSGVVALMLHHSELRELNRLLQSLDPRWLMAAAAIQTGTYFCAAGVWRVALLREGRPVGLLRLVRVSLVMLFTNQAFPSGGLSGGAVVVHALRRRHVPADVAMGALLVGLMTTYIAYLVAIPISLLLLRLSHALSVRLVAVTAAGAAIVFCAGLVVVWYRRALTPRLRGRLTRVPGIGPILVAIGTAPTSLLHDRAVLTDAAVLQIVEFALDAATLHVILVALGVHTSPAATFSGFVVASALSRVVPVPMGLGSSEGALVLMLRAVGIPLEAAMTATFIFRTFTFWLPMLPGLVFARWELWRKPAGIVA